MAHVGLEGLGLGVLGPQSSDTVDLHDLRRYRLLTYIVRLASWHQDHRAVGSQ